MHHRLYWCKQWSESTRPWAEARAITRTGWRSSDVSKKGTSVVALDTTTWQPTRYVTRPFVLSSFRPFVLSSFRPFVLSSFRPSSIRFVLSPRTVPSLRSAHHQTADSSCLIQAAWRIWIPLEMLSHGNATTVFDTAPSPPPQAATLSWLLASTTFFFARLTACSYSETQMHTSRQISTHRLFL